MKIEDVAAIYDTHNNFCEGGRKAHVLNINTGKCLCGYVPFLYNEVFLDGNPYNNIVDWVAQPDPDKNICQRCKGILINKLEL